MDGFRALAHVRGRGCELISRNGHTFRSWPHLAAEVAGSTRCRSAVIDGEVCCAGPDGRPDFYALMSRRREPIFYAFDLLMLNGRDLRGLPLHERKRRLREIMPRAGSRLLYLDHVAERGRDLVPTRV